MLDPADTTDFQLRRGRTHMTGGGDAVWGLDPSEICARMEEEEEECDQREREALREEIFNTLLEYLFADGPEPWHVSARARAYLYAVTDHHPDPGFALYLSLLCHRMSEGGEDDFWVDAGKVEEELDTYKKKFREIRKTLSGKAPMSSWFDEMKKERDGETVWDSLHSLSIVLFSQGHRPRQITGVAYCLAKTLKPHLIASMSLHSIAVLSGDGGGRATPQARCQRVYTLLLQQAGARATRYDHQKSATCAEACSDAQVGNRNRTKNQSKKRK